MLELPAAHYFLGDKVGAAHWVPTMKSNSLTVEYYNEIES